VVPLNRALSKLRVASRTEATALIRAGRVMVDGRVVRDPLAPVSPERARIAVNRQEATRAARMTVMLHKPRGVLTARRDPEGRPTVYDLLGDAGTHLVPVGRLDLATTGLLLLTTDTKLANWLTDPAHAVPRVYIVTVRGLVTEESRLALELGIYMQGERLVARSASIWKASNRETHLTVTLTEGKNREVRRLFKALGHDVTRLKRVSFGGLDLGKLQPGRWRVVSGEELRGAFPRFGASPASV
jgi:23S rRNA pseudouridine2605 synthase